VDRICAIYLIETPLAVEKAAEVLAGEQSSGAFVEVPGETSELRERFGARVESIRALEDVSEPSLPGCRVGSGIFHRAEITISWPTENVGFNLPALVSTVQGNLYELSQFSGLKLLDIELPASFATGLANSLGKLATMGLAPAVFSPWMNVSGSLLANYWRRRPVKDTIR